MARRRIVEEPPSRLAIWARRLALFALAAALIATMLVRAGFIEPLPGIATFGGALLFAAAAIVLSLGAFVVIWREGLAGFGYAVSALIGSVLLIAYPAYLGATGYNLPAISDITTDTADPPRFERVATVRPREANSVAYPGPRAAALQKSAYPDIEPLLLAITLQEAHSAALNAVNKRKWLVLVDRAPQPGRRDGHIEAVARTTFMGFREDVVVRIRTDNAGVRVDIRSASRYGSRDLGSNAARIRRLNDDILDAVGAQARAKR